MRIHEPRTHSAFLARQERLRFVESMLLWEGLLQRQRVSDAFGINLNHVTRDLRYYQAQFPGALDFRPEQRGYVAGPKFKPHFASDAPAEYLGWLQTRADAGATAVIPPMGGQDLEVATVPSPALGIDKEVLREVVRGQRRNQGVTVTYLSLSSARQSQRTLWPHGLINTGLRWYVRAYDSESQSFRSFVLARIERAKHIADTCPVETATDFAWHETVIAQIGPHADLNAHQKKVIAREFGMTRVGNQWRWIVELRQCLVGHFARRYRLDEPEGTSAMTSWLVLQNRAALQPFFLPSGSE